MTAGVGPRVPRWVVAAAALAIAVPLGWIPLAAGHEIDPITEPCQLFPNDGNAQNGRVGQGQSLRIVALGSGFFTAIAAAEYLIDPLMPVDRQNHHQGQNGNPMTAVDGAFGSGDEVAEAYNDTSFLPLGTYTVFVHVLGTNGQWSQFKQCSLEVLAPTVDTTGPVATWTGFLPDNLIAPGDPASVTINATFDDSGDPGSEAIASAEYWYSGCGYDIDPPLAGDPASIVAPGGEVAEVRGDVPIDTTGWPDGTYTYYIAATDSAGNAGLCYRADLFIVRNTPGEPEGPVCSGILANPATVLSSPSASTMISGTCDDSGTGGNGVFLAEYFVDPDPVTGAPLPLPLSNGTGTILFTSTPPWGDDVEGVFYSANLSSWRVGSYTICVHGRDTLGAWGPCANTTLTILATGPSDLRISLQGNDLRLDWTPAGMAGLSEYHVYRAMNDVRGFTFAPANIYATVPAGATSWLDPSPNEAFDGNDYFFVVRASDGGVEDGNLVKVGKVAIDLAPGVNEVSVPFVLQDDATANVFAHLAGQYTSVGQYDPAAGWRFFNTTGPQDLTTLDYRRGIRVVVSQAARFIALGAVPTTTVNALSVGWNFLSYNALVNGPVPSVLDNWGLAGAYEAVLVFRPANPYDQWAQYRVGESDPFFLSLVLLQPGDGVWIRATGAATWSPPGEW